MTHTINGFLIVPVLPDYKKGYLKASNLIYTTKPPHKMDYDHEVELPLGNYTILCTSSDITEEQAKMLVDRLDVGGEVFYKVYDIKTRRPKTGFTALHSFRSLLQSLNLTSAVVLKID